MMREPFGAKAGLPLKSSVASIVRVADDSARARPTLPPTPYPGSVTPQGWKTTVDRRGQFGSAESGLWTTRRKINGIVQRMVNESPSQNR